MQGLLGYVSSNAASGIRVNRETALRSMAVLACLIVRSETHSALPVDVYRKAGRYRIDATTENPDAYRVLAVAPNPLMTAGEFWRWEDLREDLHGNAYARIVWRGYNPVEIWPMTGTEPRLAWDKGSGTGAYEYHGDDFTPANAYPLRDILHFKAPVLKDPTRGTSIIDLASEAIGVALGSEQFFARLLGNGNHFPGWLESEAALTKPQLQQVSEELKGFSGIVQAGVIRIFHGGLKYKSNPMSIKDADLTNQMRWQLQQICSVFRVPLAMVQELQYNTYTNSEQQDLWLAKHTITPMAVNKERVIRHKLFSKAPDYYMRWNMNGLLRGDYKTRMEGYSFGVNAGFMTRNEPRTLEDMNPIAGLDMPVLNLGYGTVDSAGVVTSAAKPTSPAAVALAPILNDALACIRGRVEKDERQGVAYDKTLSFATEKLAPLIEAYALAGLELDALGLIAQAVNEPAEVIA